MSCCQVWGDAVLSFAPVAGFSVEEAVEQPHGVKYINHKDTEQQFSYGAPFGAALTRLWITRWEHGSRYYSKSTTTKAKVEWKITRLFASGQPTSSTPCKPYVSSLPQHPSGGFYGLVCIQNRRGHRGYWCWLPPRLRPHRFQTLNPNLAISR